MIGANAVANEVAVQMLDKFDLTDWRFAGEDTTGGAARVLVVPPELPPGTGYFVVVPVNSDEPLGPQIEKAVENLGKLMEGGSVKSGSTPDDKLDGFFAGLNQPPEIAAARKQQVMDERHPKEEQPSPPQ